MGRKQSGKPALMAKTCDSALVSDQERIACGLHIASRGLASGLTTAVQSHGLTWMEANLLLKLDFGLDSPSEIATYMGIDASNLSRLMRKMDGEKLIKRVVDEENRSRVVISLTAKGQKLVAKIKPDVRQAEQVVMSSLSQSERGALTKLLKKLCGGMMEQGLC